MSEVDFQTVADQLNFQLGENYSADDVRRMIDRITRTEIVKDDFSDWVNIPLGSAVFYGRMKKQPDRVYRINPKMTAVDMLHKAVFDAGYDIVAHRALLRKENPI